ncbi:hypothetical protein C1702_10880 [Caldimonas thermodepolymerans]|mgnify:FL=1|jgi:hypothetical protein|uniref:Uncharacterized protein n=2 Tax=Caldimonas thermodepolymerans TaxID=215580 RepID=A0A2S5T3Y0_9BURK|nr:hypothetical protein C1702_10880 [Caldimonas thermodepolymerans]RDI01584.1 hypothetical protein DES46_103147 [Caldimonas thermodepolymerans]TCP04968.1 hypothetical protein EV676_10954 [Caldimonas thermodepolymerans]
MAGMLLRLVAFLFACVLLGAGLLPHASSAAPAAPVASCTLQDVVAAADLHAAAEAAPLAVEEGGTASLSSPADIGEQAVLPDAFVVQMAPLAAAPPQRLGMSDIASAHVDALLRPPSVSRLA